MKYTAVLALFLVAAQAKPNELVQVIESQGMTAWAEVSSSSSGSDNDDLVQYIGSDKDSGIIDVLTPPKGACETRLWMSADELDWQMDRFSRAFDITNYENAMKIASKLGVQPPRVKTWELLDGAFSFPRVRRFNMVQSNMDMLEHFQDNLNMNMSNRKNVENFIRVGKTVVGQLNEKYHDGGFADPADTNPRDD